MTTSPRARLNSFLANRWKEMGEPSLMRQHKYSLLLRSIRAEKRLVALELLDLMLVIPANNSTASESTYDIDHQFPLIKSH